MRYLTGPRPTCELTPASLSQRWSPSFRQLSDQIKVKSGFIGQAAWAVMGGAAPRSRSSPTVYTSLGTRRPPPRVE